MDLWDLTRLLFRRWYFALPILLVSALMAIVVTQTVEPDYRSTGNVVLIPAPGDPADEAARLANKPLPNRPKNPWLDLGFEALGSAAILKVMDQNTLKSFDERGLSDSVTVTMAQRNPIFLIEVVGSSPAQATATVREVIRVLASEVADQQGQYKVMPQDTITTLTLTDGADVEVVTSKVTRILVVTVGLGLLLTAAGTIGLDVLIRMRRSRRRELDDEGSAAGVAAMQSDEDDADAANAARRIRPRFVASRGSAEETQVISRIPTARGSASNNVELAKVGSTPSAGGRPTRGTDDDKHNTGRRSGAVGAARANGDSTVRRADGEATIILPLPHRQWAEQDDRAGER